MLADSGAAPRCFSDTARIIYDGKRAVLPAVRNLIRRARDSSLVRNACVSASAKSHSGQVRTVNNKL